MNHYMLMCCYIMVQYALIFNEMDFVFVNFINAEPLVTLD